MMSCDSAPDMLISSPDEVERKAAKAPAATSAPSTMPRLPAAIMRGRTSTTESVWPEV